MSRFLSPALSAVTPYTPGEQPQDQQYIKLNTNESPYLPSPRVVAAVSEAEVEKLRLYSDPACAQLLRTAAAHFGLQPSQVMPGNGSDENLFFALRAFCDESHPLAFADITYGCYGVWCGLLHIPAHIIPLKEDFTLAPADYHGLHETIVIANPNAPTGLCLPREAIEGILQSNPDSVVIVDEAYVDFGGESCVPLIDQYENLLVVQTFSKSRQLAGARLGLAMGNAKLIADLNRVKFSLNPYNINRLTLKAGQAALEDTDYFDKTRAAIVETRGWTKQQLEARPSCISVHDFIEIHLLSCFTAMVLMRILQRKTKDRYSIAQLKYSLTRANCIHIQENLYLFSYYDEVLQTLTEVTGVPFSQKILPLGEIKQLLANTKK